MPRMTWLAPVAAVLVVLSLLTACSSGRGGTRVAANCKPAHTFGTVKKGELNVASFDLKPFTEIDGTRLSGVEGDTLTAVAGMECLSLVAVNSSPAAAIAQVQQGRVDTTAACWYRTKARAQVVALSDPVFADQMALISKTGITDISQIKARGLKVGTLTGYLWDDDLTKYLGPSLKLYSATANAYGDLKAGRVDVVADSYGAGVGNGVGYKVVKARANPNVAASRDPAQCNFPMRKSNTGLAAAMDADIKTLRANGTLAKLLKQYGLDPSAANPGPPTAL